MSELKAMTVIDAYQLECNDNDLVYIKSEADKAIADFEESHKMEVEQLLMEIVKLKDIELRRWDITCKFDVEDQELYTKWKPLPSAPKDEK